ncbi:putative late blight resistance protein -like protein R1B-14 isoform 2 [Capsicum annuum]|nr:putative late blight resistance protein -like protein R1B-14 isoform 2 [Capsicum annuum]KAF3636964.1 putative late blight resistance protein -like protein R1B-14 isoform 2 [Capsicum annuum]
MLQRCSTDTEFLKIYGSVLSIWHMKLKFLLTTLSQYNALWYSFGSLPAIIKEISCINVEVTEMRSLNLALMPFSVVEPSKYLSAQYSNPLIDEEIVGFEDDTEKMIQYLIRGTNELDVLPIIGMGGQGKTTIARKLYDDESVVSHFDVLAWCIISQTYNWRELLQDIFSRVTSSKDKGDKNDILADKLRKSLMGKRYLIVLDDMWDGMAWDELSLCFPDVGNRSRIIVTTRLEKVGEHVKHYTDLYFLPFLTPDESCKLLQKRVFQKYDCPPELQDVSLAVAKRCKGLPLVVVLAAGIIKRKKMEAFWWHEVKGALFDYLDHESGEYSLSTMKLSYDNLPDYLKPCLLYIGMFPEDARILVSKLICLWIAEGFIQITESAILMEEAAEGYLMDLISSNLVMVSKRKYNGKIKYCQVHDVVLHFCLERSREEKFMLAVESSELHFQPSHWKASRVTFCFSNELTKFASPGSKTRKPFHQYLRSLITTKSNRSEISYQNPFSQVTNLRLLKVLDLSSHIVHYLSSATLQPLIHLKDLAVTADKFHFHEKSHLLLLKTLVVKWLCGRTWLPTNFWKMEKLRHVEITRAVSCWEELISKESSKLENLRILRSIDFALYKADCLNILAQRCPNLQELETTILREDSKSARTRLNLESFTQLQILRLSVDKRLILSKLYLPSNLKKLILRVVITENTISLIAGLPSLEYLQLRDEKYYRYDEKLCLGDITFHRLKFLKLVSLDFTWWGASEESFPLLETLTIKRCDKLWSIPYSFADIQTLKQIKFIGCNNQPLVASAVRIKKEVQDIEGCNRIDVIIEVSRNKLLYAVFEYLCAYNVLPCDQKVMGSSRETASCRSVV